MVVKDVLKHIVVVTKLFDAGIDPLIHAVDSVPHVFG